MTVSKKPPRIWAGQLLHFGALLMLIGLTGKAWQKLDEPFPVAFWTAVALPIAHQVFVWLAWRLELRNRATSSTIGFPGYLILFFLLFGGRFVTLAVLGSLDRDSLGLSDVPQSIATILLILPGLYAAYSVQRYFGVVRAAGADHFDPRYREMPLVGKGIFRFTNNGMYCYAFLLFWAIALAYNSSAALVVAAFNHAYIWVHFFATEKPDMRFLYEQK